MEFKKKMLFVYNANAGKGYIKSVLSEIIETFCRAGIEITIYATGASKEATQLISENGENYDIVACSGGDGTINEVISGVMLLEKKPAIAYFPTGTVNDFARSLRLPQDPLENAALVAMGKCFPCDIGSFGDRYFNYIAAFGAFTEVAYETPQDVKNQIGKMAYFLESVRVLPEIRAYRMKVITDKRTYEDEYIYGMISNSYSVGGFKLDRDVLDPDLALDDGLFEVVLVKNPRDAVELEKTFRAVVQRDRRNKYIIFDKVKSIRIISDKAVKWTLDGENGGRTKDVTIKCNQKAVRIFSPKGRITEK